MSAETAPSTASGPLPLQEQFSRGLDAPICLTWELTYACNLACVHCLSSSGRRDPGELTPAEARGIVDDMVDMKVFYINIGGGEPMLRPDFFDLVSYAVDRKVGVKFSTNGTRITAERARQLAALDYLDVQVSIDGATAATNDLVRGSGSFAAARTAMDNLAAADFGPFKISVVITRQNVDELDALAAIADSYGAQLRLTRLRPSGRAVDTWDALHPTAAQQRTLYHWLIERPGVLTGDSFFHLSALGEPLDGLNLCGAGRVVCLIDPIGDVYACPFVIDNQFLAGNVRDPGGFPSVWRESPLFTSLREPQSAGACASCGSFDACRGGCMAAKFFTGLPLDGPDPECVHGHGETALAAMALESRPQAAVGHSKVGRDGTPIPVPTPVRVSFRSPARA
jgi:mycofactocin biosynthetic radical S-adenosylmethionine protein MftC